MVVLDQISPIMDGLKIEHLVEKYYYFTKFFSSSDFPTFRRFSDANDDP